MPSISSNIPTPDSDLGRASSDPNDDPVCVVGIACHLPGSIRSPCEFWDFLAKKKSAQSRVPEDRFNVKGFYHRDGNRAGALNADGGYFIQEDVRLFENSFFGISNIEAAYMDPQQRKLLEVVFECLENAGEPLEKVSGTNTGVYVGRFTLDHQTMQARDPDTIHRYSATGGGTTILANRISHVFNLQGPSFTLDTACSSSIYCLDSAVNAIKRGDCDNAVVAAVNLITAPEQCLATMKAGVLSTSSTCHTFDASADGYGRADGVSAVYLKRFSSAMRDRNKIWAVVRGTAVNSNGKTPGITLPSVDLQEAVIRKAYRNAGVRFADTDYIECHGTGTAVGDPIEVEAISRCFSDSREIPLLIGAVKTNLGHSEASSGLTSLIKIVLAFDQGKIPPTRGLKKLNPKLRLNSMKIVTELERWPRALRRASINSFGYGGANAHAILESVETYSMTPCPPPELGPRDAKSDSHLILPISATSVKSLDIRFQQISRVASTCDWDRLESLAYTLSTCRSQLKSRRFLLAELARDGNPTILPFDTTSSVDMCSGDTLPFVYIFTGQGAQYSGMAREILVGNQIFLATIRELDRILHSLPPETAPNWSIERSLLEPTETDPTQGTIQSQTFCTAVQIAIVALLRSWSVHPDAVIGHSSGEIAASYAAGFLNQRQAILVAYFRGFAASKLQTLGSMMAASLSVESAQALIQENGLDGKVCIACINSPESVTLSGSTEGIQLLETQIREQKKACRILRTNGRAYHSHMIKDVGRAYENMLQPLFEGANTTTSRGLTIQMHSSVGNFVDALENPHIDTNWPKYWRENLEKPVQFDSALRCLAASNDFQFLEVGPHPALKGPVSQILASMGRSKDRLKYSPTLVRDRDANFCMKQLAGTLFMRGYNLHWPSVNLLTTSNRVPFPDLPPYPWDYSAKLLYHESRLSYELRNRTHVRHELLGSSQYSGNGIDWSWRNDSLRLKEVPWMRDHTVGTQIVFPAAAYLAMIIEGLNQVRYTTTPSNKQFPTFEFRNVSFNSALVVDEEDVLGENTELHTTISPLKISATSTSSTWKEFNISSWKNGRATLHCVGRVRELNEPTRAGSITVDQAMKLETVSTERWYDKFAFEGLDFGQNFHSVPFLEIDNEHKLHEAIGLARLRPEAAIDEGSFYAMHPITIDACLQTGIMSTCAGDLAELKAYLPVFMKECRISSVSTVSSHSDLDVKIHARSKRTGVNTQRISCTLRDSEGRPLIEIGDMRMSQYAGRISSSSEATIGDAHDERHPCLRVLWKPDIRRLQPGSEGPLHEYISHFLDKQDPDLTEDENLAVVGALLDLAGHKKPEMRVLEFGEGCHCKSKRWSAFLDKDTSFPRFKSWNIANIATDGTISADDEGNGPFDTIVMTGRRRAEKFWTTIPASIFSILADDGIIITPNSYAARASLQEANFLTMEVDKKTLLSRRRRTNTTTLKQKIVYIVVREPSTTAAGFASFLLEKLRKQAGIANVKIAPIQDVPQLAWSEKVVCISLLEIENPYLATMDQKDLDVLRCITNTATRLLWVTGGGMLGDSKLNPNLTLANGLSRALMLEQPSLWFAVLDVGSEAFQSTARQVTCQNIIDTLSPELESDDKEYIQLQGILYVSRFSPESNLNSLFQHRLRPKELTEKAPLAQAKPAQLSIGKVGVTDSIYFQQLRDPPTDLPAGFVDVEIQVVSLNAKDVYALNGRVETQKGSTAMEFGGIVVATGPDVPESRVKIGDRVIAISPSHFATTTRVPAWAVHRVEPDEDLTVLSGLPIAYCTALYALHDRARLRAGETVLIHSGTGSLGIAAITIAQRMGAVVYATVGSSAKKDWLVNHLSLSPSNVFDSHDASSFVTGVREATQGRGVDVIINSLTGDLMHSSWDCIAEFGRFVEVGKRELVDAGKLDMAIFLRNATFTAFDLSEMYFHKDQFYRDLLTSKVNEVLELFRAGEIKQLPTKKFDVAEITSAYRYFSKKDRVGKVVVSLENPSSLISVSPAKYLSMLDPCKVYLLVGCLGGLGRSLSEWLFSRGARHFVFLGRSGCDKPAAKDFIMRLQDAGARITVVRGDICNATDVSRAVKCCADTGLPLGGVVQASMGLSESLFTSMTSQAWQKAIQPKWAGTWNIDSAIRGSNSSLDFFLLLSSISGTVGTATESNYCAANGFLDAVARKMRLEGIPAVSLGLGMVSEVGYLHENPEVEALLLRRGIQPLTELEFLQMVDFALLSANNQDGLLASDSTLSSHILTGLEPLKIRQFKKEGFDVSHTTAQDPRASILSAALHAQDECNGKQPQVSTATGNAPWLSGIPSSALPALMQHADALSLELAILRSTRKCFSSLVLMSEESLDDNKPLSEYGVDSMIASEFRTWVWTAFKVDVPFLDILNQGKSLLSLSNFIRDKLIQS
ncbi:hypothetical protein NUW58_g1418 [Xylaria curta]|uniref:Uncharacterized protein n=1 Tax=Xylaria curta TaxID=42375 RepID=A0ACC1PNK9_9PEZI|nr:hypothetical protein NUW58_g1418 [Xylaria curta]